MSRSTGRIPVTGIDLITCIVQRGRADAAVKAAMKAGATGATMFYARGTGVRQTMGLLGNLIQPEKEVILIVTKKNQTDKVFDVLVEKANLKKPGQGFAFVHHIEKAVGFIGQMEK